MTALALLVGASSGVLVAVGDAVQARGQEAAGPEALVGSEWDTTYGTMVFSSAGETVRATYSGQDGTLQGTLDDHVYSGFWTEPDASVECDEARNGTTFWGQFVFTFSEDFTSFDGSWGYCLEAPDAGWTGTRSSPGPAATPSAESDLDPPEPEPEIPDECLFGGQAGRRRIVGVITAVAGTVEIQRGPVEDFEPATSGSLNFAADPDLADVAFLLREGDVIRTGDDGLASVTYFEEPIPLARLADSQGVMLRDLTNAGTAQIDLVPNSAACPGTVEADQPDVRTFGVLRGAFHWLTQGWDGNGIFSVRPGTTVVGIRGTEFLVVYDPTSGLGAVLVQDGSVEVANGEQQRSVEAGTWTWAADGADTVMDPEPLAPDDYDAVRNARTNEERLEILGIADSGTAEAQEASTDAVDSENDGRGAGILVAAILVVVALGGGAVFAVRRRRSSLSSS